MNTITASTITTFPAVMLQANTEQQLLSELLRAQGFAPTTGLAVHFVVSADQSVNLIDDLEQHGYSNITLHFQILAHARFVYLLREVSGFIQASAKSSTHVKRTIICTLAGEGADALVRCLYFGDGNRTFAVKTHQEHTAGKATSNVVVKAVLTDSAKLTCHSMIRIAPGADGSLAEQVNKNILLSNQARAVSVPMLEVLANDVKCKHGAAVSKLDSEQMFYLQSRGLTPAQTQSILLEAFLT